MEKELETKKKEMAERIPYVHKDTVAYMKKHKQGMFSKADKKLVKENTSK